MKIAILVFDKLTALDAIGPYEVLSRLPEADLRFVAKEPGMKRTDTGALGISADRRSARSPTPTSCSSPAARATARCSRTRRCSTGSAPRTSTTKWTTSVCTGSLVLAAAGVLDGKRATSHWAYRDELRAFGAEPVAERVVVDGKVVTAAGVSAGIDMALHLTALEYGEDWSRRGSSSGSSTTPSRRSTRGRPRRRTRSWSSSSARSPRARGSRAPG